MPTPDTTKYWIGSDYHLYHYKIIQYGRPEDYQEKLIKGLDVIDKKDVFINLGDICIGRDTEANEFFYNDVYGKHILVRGNHDNKSLTFYNKYWDFVCDEFMLRWHGKNILFSHLPIEKREGIDFNIHGHFHTMKREERLAEYPWYDDKYHKLISMEDLDYKPILLSSLIK
jgi:calcineurin-like phosphoesterase family protein